jgi:hypothetical protein
VPLSGELVEAEAGVVVLVGLDVDEADIASGKPKADGVNDVDDWAAGSVRTEGGGGEDEDEGNVGFEAVGDGVAQQFAVGWYVRRDAPQLSAAGRDRWRSRRDGR